MSISPKISLRTDILHDAWDTYILYTSKVDLILLLAPVPADARPGKAVMMSE